MVSADVETVVNTCLDTLGADEGGTVKCCWQGNAPLSAKIDVDYSNVELCGGIMERNTAAQTTGFVRDADCI